MERCCEAEERPKAFEELGRHIQQYLKAIEAYKMEVTSVSAHASLCGLALFQWHMGIEPYHKKETSRVRFQPASVFHCGRLSLVEALLSLESDGDVNRLCTSRFTMCSF